MNKTAIVTGASGNLGQAVINKLIEDGYAVCGTVTPTDKNVLDFPVNSFDKTAVNLQDEKAAAEFVQKVIENYTTIDAAVLTVGGFAMGNISATSTTDIQNQYKLNFETAYNVARPVFTQMMKQGSGRIFLVGSRPGLDAKSGKGMIAYGLAKSLIFRLTELMNEEAKGTNVVTVVIVPSTIDTPQNRKSMPDASFDNWVKPGDIANVISLHCKEETAILRETVLKVYNKA